MPIKGKHQTNNLKSSQFSGGSVPGWTDAQNNTARQVMVEFMSRGASAAGASGVVGNWFQESSLNAAEAGGGLGQWIGSRWASLRDFASSIGAPVGSIEAQSRFAIHEMQTGYPGLWKDLQIAKDPRLAALMVSRDYERPGIPNNTNRQNAAALAYKYLAGGINTKAVSQIYADQGGGGGNSQGPTSVLGLLSSPVDQLGGWLASIAFGLVKNTAIYVLDDMVTPFWHWNQRAVDNYMKNLKGNDLLWTSVFWGFGYALLFTDPESGNLRPAPVRRSRLARHVRSAQSLPARTSLIKPKDVSRKTPKKPTPQISRAPVIETGTMQANRRNPVEVTGTHGRRTADGAKWSEVPAERAGTRPVPYAKHSNASRSESDTEHRTGTSSLPDSPGTPRGNS